MTNRRSFFKRLGLAASIVITSNAETPAPPPPIPKVKTKAAYVSTIAGHEPRVINHSLNSLLVCAMAGDRSGKARPAEVEALGLNSCKVTVPKPQRGFFSWRKKEDPLYSLIVYVPA